MKYSKKDLMQEGWASMETLLNEEMPTQTKDNNYKLIALFVLCAFGIGIFTGTKLNTKGSTAEVIYRSVVNPVNEQSISMNNQDASHRNQQVVLQDVSQEKDLQNTMIVDQNQFASTNGFPVNALATNENIFQQESQMVADFNQAPSQEFSLDNNAPVRQPNAPSVFDEEQSKGINLLSLIPFKKFVTKGLVSSSIPQQDSDLREQSNWVLGFGMNTGVNIDRNTKVLSLNSDWMYKLGKNNSIGVQVLYAAEDEFASSSAEEPVNAKPDPKGQEAKPAGINIQSPKQYRVATGLIIQQEIGYRFYSNIAFGVDMLQNSYSDDLGLRSYNNVEQVKYHFGGYSSLSLGYKLSKLIDLEVSGTKSMFLDDAIYVPGNSNQIVGGVKINF